MSHPDPAIPRDVALSTRTIGMKLEVVVIPVSDVDRAKRFYGDLGWRLDADFVVGDDSGSSSTRRRARRARSTSAQNHLGRAGLGTRDCTSSFRHRGGPRRARRSRRRGRRGVPPRRRDRPGRATRAARVSGPDPERRSYCSYATFSDPDGNEWLLQEVTARLPGRVDADATTFTSSSELASALRRAAAAHGEHEKRTGQHDADWPDWYAEYIVREQAGKELPT